MPSRQPDVRKRGKSGRSTGNVTGRCKTKMDKPWRNEEKNNVEEDMLRLLEKESQEAAKSYNAKTGAGAMTCLLTSRWI